MFTPVNDYGSGKLLWVDVDGIRRWLGQAVGGYLIETTVDQGGEDILCSCPCLSPWQASGVLTCGCVYVVCPDCRRWQAPPRLRGPRGP